LQWRTERGIRILAGHLHFATKMAAASGGVGAETELKNDMAPEAVLDEIESTG